MNIEKIKQAWDEVEAYCDHTESCRYLPYKGAASPPCTCGYKDAVTALRTALAQNPLGIADRAYFAGKKDGIAETLAQPEQEPVAQIYVKNGYWIETRNAETKDLSDGLHSIYTAPVSKQAPVEYDAPALYKAKSEREQTEKQEPVGQLCEEAFGRGQVMWFKDVPDGSLIYTATPNKPWVSLTDDEKLGSIWTNGSFHHGVEWAEAKLKEKNT